MLLATHRTVAVGRLERECGYFGLISILLRPAGPLGSAVIICIDEPSLLTW